LPILSKSVLLALVGLVVFAVLAHFVKAALFGAVIYAWIAIGLALYCLLVPAERRHALVRLHADWTGGHAAVHAAFVVMLLVAGDRLSAFAYALVVGWWLFRSGHLRPGGR